MAGELVNLVVRVNRAIRSDRSLRIAVSTALSEQKPRIFEKGLDENNAQIGTYGTNPISIARSKQARNTGRTYFPGGYSEYKSAVGKNPGFVILRNTDQMMQDYGIVGQGNELGAGFQNPHNYEKSQWMMDKYNKNIFFHSQAEVDVLGKVLEDELSKSI